MKRNFRSWFFGITNPKVSDDKIELEPLERLGELDPLEESILKDELRQKQFKRRLLATLIVASLSAYLGWLIYGANTSDYKPASMWWAVAGPIVGYLVNDLYRSGRGNGKDPP